MKKLIVIISVIIALTSCAFAGEKTISPSVESNLKKCEFNIKLLSNALELYANDHYMDYPTKKEFYSRKFDKYIRKSLGKDVKNTDEYYRCPPDGWLMYQRSSYQKAYTLKCRRPQKYGLKALCFSSKDGFVKIHHSEKHIKTGIKPVKKDREEVTESEKNEMIGVIKELYKAYQKRDLEKVMELEHEAIMRSGKEAERKGKYTAVEVYYAFKGTARDVFRAEGFGMEPLKLDAIRYKKEGGVFKAYSAVPIIVTKQVAVGNMRVRLRIAAFEFERMKGKLKIVKMQLY